MLVVLRTLLGLIALEFPSSARCDLSQYTRMRHYDKCNASGAKSNILHDREQLKHLNPYELFTKLPLAFLVF
jgi:hypothetical protein